MKDKFHPAKTYMPSPKKPEAVISPNAQEESQAHSQLLQGMMQELGFAPPPPPEQQQGQPRDLLEMLHGGQVPGREPVNPEEQQQPEGEPEERAAAALQEKVAEAEEQAEDTNQRLAKLLAQVKEQIPSIMQLHDSNPQAFKQAMNVVSKLLTLANRRQKTSKSEVVDMAEDLNKAIRRREGYKSPGGRAVHN